MRQLGRTRENDEDEHFVLIETQAVSESRHSFRIWSACGGEDARCRNDESE
jgi:hypothetical protein